MYINHTDSSTKNLTVSINDKRSLNVLNSTLKQQLLDNDSIHLKLTTHQLIVAKALGFNSHNDLVHSLPIRSDAEDFILSFVDHVNCTSSVKVSERSLKQFILALVGAQLARKILDVLPVSSRKKRPLFESMGPREFDMPFPVYVFLDHETSELYVAKTEKQYCPEKLFFGIEEAFKISPELSSSEVNELMNEIKDNAEALLNESCVVWDGKNFKRVNSKKGEEIREALQIQIDEFLEW